VDQAKLIATRINFNMKGRNDLTRATSKAAMLIGKTQYPSTQTD
jgi:hypothetical protein